MEETVRFRASKRHGWRFLLFTGMPVIYLILAFTQEPDSRAFYTLAALALAFTVAGITMMIQTATGWAYATFDQTGLTYQKQKDTFRIAWLEVREISVLSLGNLNKDESYLHRDMGTRGRIIHFIKYKPSIYFRPAFGKDFIDIYYSESAITEIRKHWGGMITGYATRREGM